MCTTISYVEKARGISSFWVKMLRLPFGSSGRSIKAMSAPQAAAYPSNWGFTA
jgi:hypothetical protein